MVSEATLDLATESALKHCLVHPSDDGYKLLHFGTDSCDWMRRASAVWGGCIPYMDAIRPPGHENGPNFFFAGCDDTLRDVPFEFCPGCGRRLVLIDPD